VMDVSFISIGKILPAVCACLREGGLYITLVKPQFEAGRENVGDRGVVRDPKIHLSVLRDAIGYFMLNRLHVLGMDYSPIRGPEGNVEFLLYGRLEAGGQEISPWLEKAEETVKRVHAELK